MSACGRKLAAFFGGFQALMPLIGWAVGSQIGPLVQAWDHWIAFVLLSAGLLATLVRLVAGPSLADRVVATDLFLTFLVMGSAVLSAREGRGAYLVVMLGVAGVGFLGTAMGARFVERGGA